MSEFMTEADNAVHLQHNQKVLTKRKTKFTDLGGFRVPIGAPKAFQTGFKQRYSKEIHVVKDIKGSTVEAEDGNKADVKRVFLVHATSDDAKAGFALGDERIQTRRTRWSI